MSYLIFIIINLPTDVLTGKQGRSSHHLPRWPRRLMKSSKTMTNWKVRTASCRTILAVLRGPCQKRTLWDGVAPRRRRRADDETSGAPTIHTFRSLDLVCRDIFSGRASGPATKFPSTRYCIGLGQHCLLLTACHCDGVLLYIAGSVCIDNETTPLS
jgi:hypothetical protein